MDEDCLAGGAEVAHADGREIDGVGPVVGVVGEERADEIKGDGVDGEDGRGRVVGDVVVG